MPYLAVDEDGTENIFEFKPIRCDDYWWAQINQESFNRSTYIELPSGTIEKIIGSKLTWKDEPYKLEEKRNDEYHLISLKEKNLKITLPYKSQEDKTEQTITYEIYESNCNNNNVTFFPPKGMYILFLGQKIIDNFDICFDSKIQFKHKNNIWEMYPIN